MIAVFFHFSFLAVCFVVCLFGGGGSTFSVGITCFVSGVLFCLFGGGGSTFLVGITCFVSGVLLLLFLFSIKEESGFCYVGYLRLLIKI